MWVCDVRINSPPSQCFKDHFIIYEDSNSELNAVKFECIKEDQDRIN